MTPRRQWLLSLGLALGGVLLVATVGGAGILDVSWVAPTTNSDGSPLTDLASYRVYYGTFSTPCPGGAFFQVPSPTPSPGPDETVAVRLIGISTGALYYVSVTAVNAAGNESACVTPWASAVARFEFVVTPTGIVNFGIVGLLGFADQTFTVQNTSGGMVSGAASTAAPFSIVSGSPFNLGSAGATQTITVRFTPTLIGAIAANVNFTANGGTVSRIVTGATPGITPPTIAINSPTAGPTYSTTSPVLTLAGIASSLVGVTQVTWVNSRGGGGVASGTTIWTVPAIELQPGTNVLTVAARDTIGSTAETSLTATLTGAFAFTDDPLTAQNTIIGAMHIMELRAAIDLSRLARGLQSFAWTDPTLASGNTLVQAVHLSDLRTALNQAYQAVGRTAPTYTDPTLLPGVTVIRAIHLNEIRSAVRALQ